MPAATAIPQKRMDDIIAYVMTYRVEDLRNLLTTNGVVDATSFNKNDVQLAFLKAMKDSASFNHDLSSYLTNMIQSGGSSGAVNDEKNIGFINQPMLNYIDGDYDGYDDYTNQPIPSSSGSSSTTSTPTTKTSGSFWSSLGSLASKENLQSLFSTGLNIASTSLQNKANQKSEQNALQLEQIRLQQLQAQNDLAKSQAQTSSGMPGWGWALIGVGGVTILGIVLYQVFKKKG